MSPQTRPHRDSGLPVMAGITKLATFPKVPSGESEGAELTWSDLKS